MTWPALRQAAESCFCVSSHKAEMHCTGTAVWRQAEQHRQCCTSTQNSNKYFKEESHNYYVAFSYFLDWLLMNKSQGFIFYVQVKSIAKVDTIKFLLVLECVKSPFQTGICKMKGFISLLN